MLTSDIIGIYQNPIKGRKHMLLKTIARKTLEVNNHPQRRQGKRI